MNSNPWADFPISNRTQWEESARQELNGDHPFEKLKILKGELSIFPYYDNTDAEKREFFTLPVAKEKFLGARAWVNAPRILVHDAALANEKALFHLNHGTEGVLFHLERTDVDVSRILSNIQVPYCELYFSGNVTDSFLVKLEAYVKTQFGTATLNGCSFRQNQLPEKSLPGIPGFHACGIVAQEMATAEETIAHALKAAVDVVEKLRGYGHSSAEAFQQIAFQLFCGTDLFHEIAKLRCLRALWQLVGLCYEVKNASTHVQVVNTKWSKDYLEPQSNLLKNAAGAMAAILGGCDSLCIEPEEEGNVLEERMARNISLLMREEAQLARVADPVAGSYYLESLTSQMMEKSWAIFKTIA